MKILKEPLKRKELYWPEKSYGAIFVQSEQDAKTVDELIKKLDEFEHFYMPRNLITINEPVKEFSNTDFVYYGKFDISGCYEKLIQACTEMGIRIEVVAGSNDDEYGPQTSLKSKYGYDCKFYWD